MEYFSIKRSYYNKTTHNIFHGNRFLYENIRFMLALFNTFFELLVKFSNMMNFNICITNIYWTKSNFCHKAILSLYED